MGCGQDAFAPRVPFPARVPKPVARSLCARLPSTDSQQSGLEVLFCRDRGAAVCKAWGVRWRVRTRRVALFFFLVRRTSQTSRLARSIQKSTYKTPRHRGPHVLVHTSILLVQRRHYTHSTRNAGGLRRKLPSSDLSIPAPTMGHQNESAVAPLHGQGVIHQSVSMRFSSPAATAACRYVSKRSCSGGSGVAGVRQPCALLALSDALRAAPQRDRAKLLSDLVGRQVSLPLGRRAQDVSCRA
jgi:hypothetical protein